MAATLSPVPKLQFFDANGAPLAGGKLYSYFAGTTTPQSTYTDSTGTTSNPNPVILDARGEAGVWLANDAFYKLSLYTSTNVLVWTVDQIASNTTLAALAASGGSALVGYLPAGTGAVATTVQSKLRESISPEDFGAVGNNVADDTVAMLAALTQAVASGLKLKLKDGATYYLASWVAFSNSGFLYIEGNGTSTLRGPASTVVFLSPATNFDIQGVTFSTWSGVVSRGVAQTGSFTDVIFSKNTCTACTAIVFNIEKPITQYRIESNNIESCTGGYGIRIGDNSYANEDTWQEGWITNNRIKSLSATGTTSAVAILIYGRRVTISDNKIDGVTQSGTGEAWGIYTKARYSQVYGNFVNNVVASGSSDNVGINIKGTTRPVTLAPQGFAVIVWGNHVSNVGVAGVKGAGIRAQTDDVLIFGNQCEDTGGDGLNTDESTSYQNVVLQNNLVRWSANVVGTVGIRMEGSGTGAVADNNIVLNGRTGISLRTGPTASTMQDAQVTRNKLFGCTNNISFDAFAGCTLDRPVIEFNVVNGGTIGIGNNGSAGTTSNMRLRFNDFARAGTPLSGSVGTTATVFSNYGVTGTVATFMGGPITANATIRVQDATNSYGGILSSGNTAGLEIQTLYGGQHIVLSPGGSEALRVIAGGNLGLRTAAAGTSGVGVIAMLNGTAPTTSPTNVGQIYVEAGALKYRGSGGTVTVIAPA